MYKKINITENHLLVLSLFTNGPYNEHHIREVHKVLGISPRTAQLILFDLEGRGVLESKTKGKTKTYRLKTSDTSQRYLVLAEQYKAIAFFHSRPLIKEVVEKIIPHITGLGLIFGSYSKGTEKGGSDLDIFVAGECDKERIIKISAIYGIDLSVKNYPAETFRNVIKNDILLKEIMDNHVIFLNAEEFVMTEMSERG